MASLVIDRLRKELTDAMQRNRWSVTVSIGAVTCEGKTCTLDEVISKADNLMYDVKKSGKNMVKHEVME
jgi:diguanylate cyclase (GGDEF)-like protein